MIVDTGLLMHCVCVMVGLPRSVVFLVQSDVTDVQPYVAYLQPDEPNVQVWWGGDCGTGNSSRRYSNFRRASG